MARGSGIVGLTILLLGLAWIYDFFIAHKQNQNSFGLTEDMLSGLLSL